MKHSNILRLERIEKRRVLYGEFKYMTDDQLLAVMRRQIWESGGVEASAAEARADRDEATALIIEASEGCKTGAELMARFDELLHAGQFEGAKWN